ncbi:MAG: hypothetical protein ACC742_06255, partial [Thermoanaerobaculales bacterium]
SSLLEPESRAYMAEIKRILLVDDDPNDVELALTALARNNLANEVMAARDGEEAPDVLLEREEYAELNEPPPGVLSRSGREKSTGEG